VYTVIIKTQNRRPNNIQRTAPQSYKTEIKILPSPGLFDSEQRGPGATLLGWPKSIYYSDKTWVFDQSERAQDPMYIIIPSIL